MKGYITAKKAAERLDYSYDHFLLLLKQGKIQRVEEWYGYVVPEDISHEDVLVGRAGRPRLPRETS